MLNASDLDNFYGSENYYKHPLSKLIYTDGVKYVAENGGNGSGAYWLIDIIASYQHEPKVRKEEFQLWTLKVANKKGVVTMQGDSDRPNVVKQEIEYTDFELPEIKFYVENGVLCLPSER